MELAGVTVAVRVRCPPSVAGDNPAKQAAEYHRHSVFSRCLETLCQFLPVRLDTPESGVVASVHISC